MTSEKIGIDLGGTKVLIIAGSFEEKVKTGFDFRPSELERIIDLFIQENQINPIGIGIAIPGLLANDGTIISCDVLPNFNGWNAHKAFGKYSTIVKSLNDVKAALAQEFHDYANDFTGGIIMVGTAVGSAFIVDGKPLLGASGWAGEFGYTPLVIDNRVSRVDELCGGSFLAKQLEMTPEEMYQLSITGDGRVIRAIEKGGYYLGVAIAGLINVLNPSKISIGGGTANMPRYWKGILEGAKENVIPDFWNDEMISKANDDYKVAALGALRLLE